MIMIFCSPVNYVTGKLQTSTLEKFIETFTKSEGDDYKSLLFAKLSPMQVRDQVVDVMRKELTSENTWVKPDKSVQERAISGFLLGLKRVLVSWRFSKQQINANVDMKHLTNEAKIIVHIAEKDGQLEPEWATAWQQWQEFMVDKEVRSLAEKFHELMARSTKDTGKGKVGPEGR